MENRTTIEVKYQLDGMTPLQIGQWIATLTPAQQKGEIRIETDYEPSGCGCCPGTERATAYLTWYE